MSDTSPAIPPVEDAGDLTKRKPDEPYLTKPTTQLDLERRQAIEAGEAPPEVGDARSFTVEGNDTSDYIGVASEYQTYANETEAPHRSEEGPEARLEERAVEFLEAPKTGVTAVKDDPAPEPFPVGSTGTVDPGALVTPAGGLTSEEIATADAEEDARFEEEQHRKAAAEAEEQERLRAEETARLQAEEQERLRAEEVTRLQAEAAAQGGTQ